jgi:hypothetical protein
VIRRPTAGRTFSHHDRNQATNRPWAPPAIATRSTTSGAWLTSTQTECAATTDQKAPSRPATTASETKVGSRIADRAKRAPAATRAAGPVPRVERGLGARVAGLRARDAPGHEPKPQDGFDDGRHRTVGERDPVDVGHARPDGQRERRPEGGGAEEGDEAVGSYVAFAGAAAEGPDREERARGVQAGQPEPQRGQQELDHPGLSSNVVITRKWSRIGGSSLCDRESGMAPSYRATPGFSEAPQAEVPRIGLLGSRVNRATEIRPTRAPASAGPARRESRRGTAGGPTGRGPSVAAVVRVPRRGA